MYKLRFVQKIKKEYQDRFLEIEKKFIDLERRDSSMPQGKRFVPVMGKEPTNTLIWEGEFDSPEQAIAALAAIEANDSHTQLLDEQIGYMVETYTELYKSV